MIPLLLLTGCGQPDGLHFDGVDDYARVEGVEGLDGDALTLEVWFTLAPGPEKANLLARRAVDGTRDSFLFRVRVPGPLLEFGLGADGREWGVAGKNPLVPGRRTMAAVTHDRRTRAVHLYVDGWPDVSAQALADAGRGADQPLWLGGDPRHGPTGRPFAGEIHAVRIWDVVRDGPTIRADVASPPPATTPGVRWAWDGAPDAPGLLLGADPGPDASDPTPVRARR